MSNSTSQQSHYGVQLLDDLHKYFPAFLYDAERFSDVRDVFAYVQDQMNQHFNAYNRGRAQYRADNIISNINRYEPIINTNRYYNANARSTATPVAPVRRATTTTATTATTATSDLGALLTLLANPTVSELVTLQAFFGGGGVGDQEPVVVAPTQQQIDSATSLSGASQDHESQQCAICQDTYVSGQGIRKINHCNHEFHRGCIDVWFQRNVRCPVCRYDIRGELTNSS